MLHTAPAGAAQGAAQCPGALDVPTRRPSSTPAADAVTCLVNAERTSRGLKALKRDGDLAQAARGHSRDMVANHYFEHTSPDGDSRRRPHPRGRLRQAGRRLEGRARTSAGAPASARPRTRSSTRGSTAPAHKQNMLTGAYRELGVGVADGAPKASTELPGATYTLNLGVIR